MTIRIVNIHDWDIVFLFSFDAIDEERILDALFWAEAPNSVISQVSENVQSGRRDEGFCFSNPSLRRSVVAIGETSSGPEYLNSTVHEIAHLALHIAEEDGIDPYGEELAYLIGDISSEISDIVCKFSCPNCRRE